MAEIENKDIKKFVYDTVPDNYRRFYMESTKGFEKGAWMIGGIFLAVMLSVITARLFYLSMLGLLIGILAAAVVTACLYLFVRLHDRIAARYWAGKIREEDKGFTGYFEEECLSIVYTSGAQEKYTYKKMNRISETDSFFHIEEGEKKLTLSRIYLKKDAADLLRKELCQRCPGVYDSQVSPEEDMIVMENDGTERHLDEKEFLRFSRYLLRFRVDHKRLVMLFCMSAVLLSGIICGPDRRFRVIVFIASMGLLALIVLSRAAVYGLTVRRLKRFHASGKPEPGKVAAFPGAVSSVSKKRSLQIPVRKTTLIRETDQFFVAANLVLPKSPEYSDGISRMRRMYRDGGICRYEYMKIDDPGIKGWVRGFLPYLAAVLFCIIFLNVYGSMMGNLGTAYYLKYNTPEKKVEKILEEVFGEGDTGESEERGWLEDAEPSDPMVTVHDEWALRLDMDTLNLMNCYCRNDITQESRFYIDDYGSLYGMSANKNGELGRGNTDPYYNAKGFFDAVEIAQRVVHVSLGKDFVIWLNEENQLWGTGNLPGKGISTTPVLLSEGVSYAKSSYGGILLLKTDGTVWCTGILTDPAGNAKVEYQDFVQMADDAQYVTAGQFAFAYIKNDGALWMWGDNSDGRCGISSEIFPYLTEPRQVREDVKQVWLDDMDISSSAQFTAAEEGYVQSEDHYTVIQQTDGRLYGCGSYISEAEFVPVQIVEEAQ